MDGGSKFNRQGPVSEKAQKLQVFLQVWANSRLNEADPKFILVELNMNGMYKLVT